MGTAALFAWLAGDVLAATPPETGDTGDVPVDPGLDLDADGDGYTPREGDCDDQAFDLSPGVREVCFDRLDNDCDGLYDEECDDSARLASLRGGGGCTGGGGVGGTTSVLLLAPLLALAGWRRSSGP